MLVSVSTANNSESGGDGECVARYQAPGECAREKSMGKKHRRRPRGALLLEGCASTWHGPGTYFPALSSRVARMSKLHVHKRVLFTFKLDGSPSEKPTALALFPFFHSLLTPKYVAACDARGVRLIGTCRKGHADRRVAPRQRLPPSHQGIWRQRADQHARLQVAKLPDLVRLQATAQINHMRRNLHPPDRTCSCAARFHRPDATQTRPTISIDLFPLSHRAMLAHLHPSTCNFSSLSLA